MSLPTQHLCCFRHFWLDHLPVVLVWYPWLCSRLILVISVISLLPCQIWSWPVFLAHILLRCPSGLCPWSFTLCHVHHSSQYPHFFLFPKPPPVRRGNSTLAFTFQLTDSSIDHLQNALNRISSWMTANRLTLNSSKTEFLLIRLSKQLAKLHLTFSDQISSVSKSCYYHICELCCIPPYFDYITASTIATSIVHSKLDYCTSRYHNLPKCQITRLQQIQNSLARAVVKAPKSSHITPILRSLHWLKITEHIEYKLLSLTYKVLTVTQPSYLHNLITVQPPRSTRSSSLVTLARPSTSCSLWITDRSFQYASPRLWNQLPASFHQPCTNLSSSASPSPMSGTSSIGSINLPLIIHHPLTLSFQA